MLDRVVSISYYCFLIETNDVEASVAFSKRAADLRKQSNMCGLILQNIRSARKNWTVSVEQLDALEALTEEFRLSVALGDLRLLDNKWYVTHGGLMRLARRNHCSAIQVRPVCEFCDPASGRWVFKATIYKTSVSKGFVGYGDADPSNVSALVRGAELRVAETRAVNRALRKAYGIGLCSVEELGWGASSRNSEPAARTNSAQPKPNGSNNGQPRLRDRLSLLVRQHQLDPTLVKRYAAEFCGTEALRDASRELVEDFINQLAEWAAKDRQGLLCHLNSYAAPQEVKS